MWNEEQRQILKIEVAGRKHVMDPMPVIRRYRQETLRVGPEIFREAIVKVMDGEDTVELSRMVMPVVYQTMGWKTFEEDPEHGYMEREALEGFTQFIEWLIDSKKKDEILPSSSATGGVLEETPLTQSISGSTSAEASSNPEGLGQSLSVPSS